MVPFCSGSTGAVITPARITQKLAPGAQTWQDFIAILREFD
jgi:hypothetical protein